MRRVLAVFSFVCVLNLPALAQLSATGQWAAQAGNQYRLSPNVTYRTVDGVDLKMDVYSRRDVDTPQPTVVYLHGGFWVAGDKEGALFSLLPWLERGWNVVNVEYRLGPDYVAPAAVEDSFCALRFVAAEAARFNVDTTRLVVTGESAGGHLALVLGMIPDSAGLADACPGDATPAVAAVVNWFGVTDVPDVIQGPNRQQAAARWFGDLPEEAALVIARRVSPIRYVRDGLPPILTIQGDADNVVPYDEGVRLHAALETAGLPNQHLSIPGGGHGRFTDAQRVEAFATVWQFLADHGIE